MIYLLNAFLALKIKFRHQRSPRGLCLKARHAAEVARAWARPCDRPGLLSPPGVGEGAAFPRTPQRFCYMGEYGYYMLARMRER